MSKQPEIKIVQYHWGEQNHSYSVSRRINEAYCRRHGYQYVVKTFQPRDDRACRWSKIPAMREELHDCDFLLYLDADAFFYSHELGVEKELIPFMKGRKIMMGMNGVCERDRCQLDIPNTGVIFVRNTETSAEILRVWDETSERPGLEGLRFHPCGEREAFWQTIWREYAEHITLLKDYYLMNGIYGMFVRHLMDMEDEDRLKLLGKFIEARKEIFSGNFTTIAS